MKVETIFIDDSGILNGSLEMENLKFILNFDNAKFISEDLTNFIRFQNNGINRIVVDEYNRISNCKLRFKFPIKILKNKIESDTFLEIELKLNYNNEVFNTNIIEQKLIIENYQIIYNSNTLDLDKLIEKLPKNWNLKCCFGCQYSDFGIYSNPFFGFMFCFKNFKNEYSKVCGKDETYIKLLENSITTECIVYETFVCSEFEIRKENVGYRG